MVEKHPETPLEIADYLEDLSHRMIVCGTSMEYYGGFGPMRLHGLEMIGAAKIAKDWAEGIRRDYEMMAPPEFVDGRCPERIEP